MRFFPTSGSKKGTVLRHYVPPTHEALALRWAPIHYHDTDVTGTYRLSGKSDYLTAVNFDNDWVATINWNNTANYVAAAHAYYSVAETNYRNCISFAHFHIC